MESGDNMPITVNENGITHELSEVWVNNGGVLHELSTIHCNDGGTLREIYSSQWGASEIEWTLNRNATATFGDNGLTVYVSEVGGGNPETYNIRYGPISATVQVPANTRVTHTFINSKNYKISSLGTQTGISGVFVNADGKAYPSSYTIGGEFTNDITEFSIIKDYTSAQSISINLSGYLTQIDSTAYYPLGYTYKIKFSKI